MSKRTVLVTPRGRAIFPKLNVPDTKFNSDGVYTVRLAISTAAAEKLIEQIDAAHKAAQEKAAKENPKKKIKEANLPYEVNAENEEETIFKFKSNAKIKVKEEIVSIRPSLFDAKGKPSDARIGGGSVLRVSFEPAPFYTATIGAGVSLRLNAVQVIELKSYGERNAQAYGFEAEEGFETEGAGEEFSEGKESTEDEAKADEGADGSNGSDF